MSYIKFLNSEEKFQGIIKVIDEHTIEVQKCDKHIGGFQLFTDADYMFGDYSAFKYDYEEPNLGKQIYRYTDDNHKWVKPKKKIMFNGGNGATLIGKTVQEVYDYSEVVVPTITANENYTVQGWDKEVPTSGEVEEDEIYTVVFTYVTPPEDIVAVRDRKIKEMNDAQQKVIAEGFDIEIDGVAEHFTMTTNDQTSMLGLMSMVQSGMELIPWHTSDNDEHCKYYTNEQMKAIIGKAMEFLTLNITYFRDLRIYINSLENNDEINAIEYGILIPDKYKSDVLRDIEAKM
jgi:hypothetical protein